jgi:hypothetical protein
MNGSGSENWETYTDASDTEESDATQAFYARQRAQQQQQQQTQQQKFRGGAPVLVGGGGSVKRAMQSPNPKGGMGKKSREVFDEVEGSEAGWTDDGDLGEVYWIRSVGWTERPVHDSPRFSLLLLFSRPAMSEISGGTCDRDWIEESRKGFVNIRWYQTLMLNFKSFAKTVKIRHSQAWIYLFAGPPIWTIG